MVPLSTSPVDALRRVRKAFEAGSIRPVYLEDIEDDVARAKQHGKKRTRKRRSRGDGGFNFRAQEIARLDEEGLTGPGELNAALFAKSADYAYRSVPFREARKLLLAWLDEKHNKHSRTYNKSVRAAHSEAVSTLERVYEDWEDRPRLGRGPGLTEFEAALIEAVTHLRGRSIVDVESGIAVSAFKLQKFLASVIDGGKAWTLNQCFDAASRVQRQNPGFTLGSRSFDASFFQEVRWFWPHPPTPLFIVENPYRFRASIPGISEAMANAAWRIAKTSNLFIPFRGASAQSHRAESFSVFLDFGLFPSLSEASQNWAGAIRKMKSASEVRETYSPFFASEIAKVARNSWVASRTGETLTLETYVRWRLQGVCVDCAGRAVAAGQTLGSEKGGG
jgi:hypothetical protein